MINPNDFLLYSEHFEGPAYLYWIEYKPTKKKKLIEKEIAFHIRDKYGLHLYGYDELIREEIERIKAEKKERERYRD